MSERSQAAESGETEPVIRPAVRVVVIDADERVLLFASTADDGSRFWFPPGGGSEPGETPEETARRELREETGQCNFELVGEIGRRRHVIIMDGVRCALRERWFLARVEPFALDTSGFSDLERMWIVDHRWWSIDELENAADRLAPGNLATLTRSLLRDGLPRHPIDLER